MEDLGGFVYFWSPGVLHSKRDASIRLFSFGFFRCRVDVHGPLDLCYGFGGVRRPLNGAKYEEDWAQAFWTHSGVHGEEAHM